MTLDERRMAIAYADLITICELVLHIMKIETYDLLTPGCRMDLANAEDALWRVKDEVGRYVSAHTAYDIDIPGYANGTTEKEGEAKCEK